MLNRIHEAPPVDESRLTGRRVARVKFKDGTAREYIDIDEDFRIAKDPVMRLQAEWTGATEFSLKALPKRLRARPSDPPDPPIETRVQSRGTHAH